MLIRHSQDFVKDFGATGAKVDEVDDDAVRRAIETCSNEHVSRWFEMMMSEEVVGGPLSPQSPPSPPSPP